MTLSAAPSVPHDIVKSQWRGAGSYTQILDRTWQPARTVIVPDEHVIALRLSPLPTRSRGCFRFEGQTGRLTRNGYLYFLPAGVPLHWQTPGGSSSMLRCIISRSRFRQLTSRGDDWTLAQLNRCLNVRNPLIKTLLLRLARELDAPSPASAAVIEACVNIVIVELANHLSHAVSDCNSPRGELRPAQLSRIETLVRSAVDSYPTIADIAATAGISARHLTRTFQKSTGQTIKAYVEDIQIGKAKALLIDTDMPMKSIAAQLGFSHANSFSEAFRRVTLETPTAYRRRGECRQG